jgi:hypothetical protein
MFHKSYQYLNKIPHHLIYVGIVLIVTWALVAQSLAGSVSIAWDLSPGDDVTGYVIHCGTQSKNYNYELNVGNVTEYTFTSLSEGINYYLAVRAYNQARRFSDYSNELAVYIGSSVNVLPIPCGIMLIRFIPTKY